MLIEYKVKDGQTIQDLAIQLYGDISFCLKILKDNNLNWNSDLVGKTIVYDSTLYKVPKKKAVVKKASQSNNIYVVKENQNIIDLAIEIYGSVDYVFKIIKDNNLLNVNQKLTSGQEIKFDIIKNNIRTFTQTKGISFATEVIFSGSDVDEDGIITHNNEYIIDHLGNHLDF